MVGTPERYMVASADRCTRHPQHVMVNQGRSEQACADVFECACGKRAIGNTDESRARALNALRPAPPAAPSAEGESA